ncbi:hypothetical protein TRFO_27584 [Tritrichomonas foetus]|uniref:IBR domain-containing protein n=1 Tax=Tritrichomonas foetus TaxID=1144522 RepID=A0A1J4K0T4_9EUKA|nr:hypothetical protein TRFO_27584 [Tritrichomonas foetus]|eukprot:OHT04859.1 hypothetical protein TRFO_27584 [Tritrichomonas foetus]
MSKKNKKIAICHCRLHSDLMMSCCTKLDQTLISKDKCETCHKCCHFPIPCDVLEMLGNSIPQQFLSTIDQLYDFLQYLTEPSSIEREKMIFLTTMVDQLLNYDTYNFRDDPFDFGIKRIIYLIQNAEESKKIPILKTMFSNKILETIVDQRKKLILFINKNHNKVIQREDDDIHFINRKIKCNSFDESQKLTKGNHKKILQEEIKYLENSATETKNKNLTYFNESVEARRKGEKMVKQCPGCNVPIEKDGGCIHMTCLECQYHFCWLCHKKYEGAHNSSNCPVVSSQTINPINEYTMIHQHTDHKSETLNQSHDKNHDSVESLLKNQMMQFEEKPVKNITDLRNKLQEIKNKDILSSFKQLLLYYGLYYLGLLTYKEDIDIMLYLLEKHYSTEFGITLDINNMNSKIEKHEDIILHPFDFFEAIDINNIMNSISITNQLLQDVNNSPLVDIKTNLNVRTIHSPSEEALRKLFHFLNIIERFLELKYNSEILKEIDVTKLMAYSRQNSIPVFIYENGINILKCLQNAFKWLHFVKFYPEYIDKVNQDMAAISRLFKDIINGLKTGIDLEANVNEALEWYSNQFTQYHLQYPSFDAHGSINKYLNEEFIFSKYGLKFGSYFYKHLQRKREDNKYDIEQFQTIMNQ